MRLVVAIHATTSSPPPSVLSEMVLFMNYLEVTLPSRLAGTLTIFVIAPSVTGFPLLTLMGQFLLKDVVLACAAITVMARDAASHEAKRAERPQLSTS